MTLFEGFCNIEYEVVSMHVDQKTKKRLQDMGITPGTAVLIMSKLGDHAYIIKVRGSRVGLGKEITSKIEILEKACLDCDQRKD